MRKLVIISMRKLEKHPKDALEKDKERLGMINQQLKAKHKSRRASMQNTMRLSFPIAGGQIKLKIRLRI